MARIRTVPQVMRELKEADPGTFVSETMLRAWIKAGYIRRLPGYKSHVLVNLDEVETFLSERAAI